MFPDSLVFSPPTFLHLFENYGGQLSWKLTPRRRPRLQKSTTRRTPFVPIKLCMDTKQSTQDYVKILFFFYSWSFGVLLWEIESGGITEPINNQVKFIQGCLVLFYQSSIQNGHFKAPLHGWTMLNKNFKQHQPTQCMLKRGQQCCIHRR